MAIDNDTKDKFIELRAKGLSYDKISTQLKVAKSTLIALSKEFELEIKNLRNIEIEALNEKFMLSKEKKLEIIKEIFEKMVENLKSRNFDEIPIDKLINIMFSMMNKLEKPDNIDFITKEELLDFDVYRAKKWTG